MLSAHNGAIPADDRPAQAGSADHGRLLDLAEAMSGLGRWRLDATSNQVFWSEEVYRIHGLDPKTFDPNLAGAVSFYHPDDRPLVDKLVARAVGHGEAFAFQHRLVRPDGQVRHVVCKADCELSADGRTIAVFGVIQDVTDQVLDVERLTRSEAKYRLLADNMGDVVARIHLDGSPGYISPAIKALLGFTPEEIGALPAGDFVHVEDRKRVYSALATMAQGATTQTVEYRALHKDGRAIWVETRLTLLAAAPGRSGRIILVIRDVSDRKAAASALAASEARYRLLTENANDTIVELDDQGRFVYVSPAIRTLLGLNAESVLGRPLLDLVHLDDVETARLAVAAAMAGAASRVEYRLIHQNGTVVWIESRPTAARDDKTGAVLGLTDVLRDVSERKAGEAALAASEARYRELADNASDMIAHCTLGGKITFVSQGCLTTLGFWPTELIGRRTLDLMHPEDVSGVRAFYRDLYQQGPSAPPQTFQFRAFHKDGRCLWLEGRPKVFFDAASGAPLSIQDVTRDITERKLMELELEQARTNAEAATVIKSEFLSNMSHELRTPLTSILGFSSILAEEPQLTTHGRRALERVRGSSDALLALVDDILDFSKLEAGRLDLEQRVVSPLTVFRAALESLEPQARLKKIELVLEDAGSMPPYLQLDDGRLRQILLNLLGNGLKFTFKGQVRLNARYENEAARLRCEVIDTGIGIAEERIDRLFKRFSQVDASTTRAFGGTGLGLAICKGLVEAMGGLIGVSSVEGEGTRFWFEIPCALASAPAASAIRPVVAGFEALSGLRVLLADPDWQSRKSVRLLLNSYGVEIIEATSTDEAATFAENTPFDLILMDGRIAGLETLSGARQLRDGGGPNDLTPLVGLLERAPPDAPAVEGVLDGWVQSPVAAPEFLDMVRRWATPYTPLANGEAAYG